MSEQEHHIDGIWKPFRHSQGVGFAVISVDTEEIAKRFYKIRIVEKGIRVR